MKKLATLFTCSCQELKQVRTITVCAMLAAVGVALGSVSIQMENMRIGFAGIPAMLSGYLFGLWLAVFLPACWILSSIL